VKVEHGALPRNQSRIEYLIDYPQHLETVAQWEYVQWQLLHPGSVMHGWVNALRRKLGRSQIPLTLVMMDGDEPIGAISLIVNGNPRRVDLTPWLASLYVEPSWRGKGLGQALMTRGAREAKALGYEMVYLETTETQQLFYAKFGWKLIDRILEQGQESLIMAKQLRRTDPTPD
tara:strand:- start:297 stop:818 length:522 start_codon:yes stop_codon:yes gene_type:complete